MTSNPLIEQIAEETRKLVRRAELLGEYASRHRPNAAERIAVEAATEIHALITEHVRTVVEAERGKYAAERLDAGRFDVICPRCDGSRANPTDTGVPCPTCDGDGWISVVGLDFAEATNRTLTEKLDKAVEGLRPFAVLADQMKEFGWTDIRVEPRLLWKAHSTLIAIEGEGHDHS